MKEFIVALDQGTTSCRSILFDRNAKIIASEQKEFTQIFPENGWVEHNPIEIWETQQHTLTQLLENNNIKAEQIDSIGITNQRETTVLWNKKNGNPVYNAIVWQDNRTKEFCQQLIDQGLEQIFKNKTGLVLDSYFSGTKVNWILKNIHKSENLLASNSLLFGTIDTWLIWNLTNKKSHFTDCSNASRTLMYNIHNSEWDSELLEALSVPRSILPTVKDSSTNFGYWEYKGHSIPITGVAGDQQAALFGQCCFEKGSAKNTYGTGCFMLMNTKDKPIKSKNGLLTTVAWSIDGIKTYALEGSVFIAGAAVQWLRDGLKVISEASESELLASKSNSNELIFVPAFSGLGAPYWNMNTKGGIFGITRDIGVNELCKATLESLAFQTSDVLTAMEKDANFPIDSLAVDGGACINNFLMQFQSDILKTNVLRSSTLESTALGAAYLAGIQTGFFKFNELKNNHSIERVFEPSMNEDTRTRKLKSWSDAIKSLIQMYN